MGKIDLGRVIFGGIVAGIVINAFETVLNTVVLGHQWTDLMASINRPALGQNQIIAFYVMGFAQGLIAVWTYAAIRPRFGVGPKTAVIAALLTWVTAYVLVDVNPMLIHVFTPAIAFTLIGVGLIEIIAATLAGAYFYKEAA